MAHESFEDQDTAGEMNQNFVNIKVDREERPDVDSTYMEAVRAMSGHGGWPMTVFLTPDRQPFFAGTYFPRQDRAGIPSFRRVMAAIAEAWQQRRDEVTEQAGRVLEAISNPIPGAAELPPPESLSSAYQALTETFDRVRGGFGRAPKFPQEPALEFLLRTWGEPWAAEAAVIVQRTLAAMAGGGIHDQLGGGFARYTVDEGWLIPHFEKMAYDNAQLARLYLWAGIEFGHEGFLDVARSTLDYLLTDLRHPQGGFYSAEDADSEGMEGKFYLWDYHEFMEVAGDSADLAARHFGVTPEGNFEGRNILFLAVPLAEAAADHGLSREEAESRIAGVKTNLLQRRRQRVRPGLDDKVLAAWNGLAIRALAEAGAALAEPRYLEAAAAAADFVLGRVRTPEGRLARSWAKDRPSSVGGFLDDYAAMGVGLLSLYAATGEIGHFEAGAELIRSLSRFADPRGGFFTSESGGGLPKRPKDLFDNPLPSGTSLAAEGLLWLSLYTGEADLRQSAADTLRSLGTVMDRYPTGAMHALSVLHSLHRGTHELAVTGERHQDLARVYWQRFRPHIVLASAPTEEKRLPLLEGRFIPGSTRAYLCSGFTCLAPVEEAGALAESLSRT
jgi:uncharacterized protein YyaL (SSP411 family)